MQEMQILDIQIIDVSVLDRTFCLLTQSHACDPVSDETSFSFPGHDGQNHPLYSLHIIAGRRVIRDAEDH